MANFWEVPLLARLCTPIHLALLGWSGPTYKVLLLASHCPRGLTLNSL